MNSIIAVHDNEEEEAAAAAAAATAATAHSAASASTLLVVPSLMDKDHGADDDDDNDGGGGGEALPRMVPKDEADNKLYIDVVAGGTNSYESHDLLSFEDNNDTTSTTTPSTPTVVEIIDESGYCDSAGVGGGGAAAAATTPTSSGAGAAAAATAASSTASPFLINKWSTAWRKNPQQQQQQPAAVTAAAAAATAAATATAFWNKHKSPSLEHGLMKRMTAVVATGLTTTTTSTATGATTTKSTTTTTTATAQPLESAKLESPLSTTVTDDTTPAAASTAAAAAGTGSSGNQDSAADGNATYNNSDADADDYNGERGGGGGASTDGGGGASTDGGGGEGSRYSRSLSRDDSASHDSSYWSNSSGSSSSSSSEDDGSSAAARGARSSSNTKNNNNTPAAAALLRGTLKWAAVSAVDSMQQSYRGRYNNNNSNPEQEQRSGSNTRPSTAAAMAASLLTGAAARRAPFPSNNNNNNNSVSQQQQDVNTAESASTTASDPAAANTNNNTVSHTQRLLHSRAHDHVAQLMKQACESRHEYLLLLGQGMLGVNLKPTFLLHRGVYVDFLVPGGAAQASQVVFPGDLLCQIGNLNVRHGGILEIPTQLAATKRPVHLVLSSGTDYYHQHYHHGHDKNKSHHQQHHHDAMDKTCYINHVDLCAAILHVILNPTTKHDNDDETKQEKALRTTPLECLTDADIVASQREQNVNDADGQQQQDANDADKQPDDPPPSLEAAPTSRSSSSSSGDNVNDQDAVESPPSITEPTKETKDNSATPASTANAASPKHENDSKIDSQTTTTTTTETINKKESIVIPDTILTVDDLLHAQIPTKAVRNVWGPETARRANHLKPRQVEEIWSMTTSTWPAVNNNDWNNLQMALKHAFILTVLDGRRFPFLTRFWTMQQQPALQQATMAAANNSGTTTTTAASPAPATSPPMNAIMMTLFLEMHTYCDLYGITPVDKRRLLVRSIAYKFFLPTSLGNNEFVPPLFDFHHIVPDSSLRQLEQVLKQMKNGTNDNNQSTSSLSSCPPRNVFWDFQQAVLELLAGKAFLSYIITDECARMRAFLRETAPYLNVPLDRVWQHLVQSGGGNKHDDDDNNSVVTQKSEEDAKNAKNYFLYVLVYLLCQMDHEPFGEHGELPAAGGNENASINSNNNSVAAKKCNRMEEAASGICAALFIQSRLLPSIQAVRRQMLNASQGTDGHDETLATMVSDYEQLWEIFLSPVVGVLHRALQSLETKARLRIVLDRLTDIQTFAQHEHNATKNGVDDGASTKVISPDLASKLVDVKLVQDLTIFAQELVYYEYATVNHSKFRAHKFHEWMCTEAAKVFATLDEPDTSGIPALPGHCIKRLLRKAEFPQGISSHKPAHHVIPTATSESQQVVAAAERQGQDISDLCRIGAECVVVFGTSIGFPLAESCEEESPTLAQTDIRRYTCQSLQRRPTEELDRSSKSLKPDEVPQMVESYALVPPSRTLAFADYTKDLWKSRDGWEVSLVNFMLPRVGAAQDGSDAPIYGVSLVLSRQPALSVDVALDGEDCIPAEFVEWSSPADDETTESFVSPISFSAPSSNSRMTTPIRRVRLSKRNPNFNAQLSERSWRDQVSLEQQRSAANSTVTVGIALVSQRNVLISMRDTLSRLVQDFSRPPDGHVQHGNCLYSCAALVDVLGNCSNPDIEPESMLCILEPYLRLATKQWIERPIGDQERFFKCMAGEQLVKSLPPIPLALMFVTVLLEQKVVFSSSRRGLLLSATTALTELLKPLKWCHLLVPRVPSALAGDLLQYPAAFILGMASEDPGILDLIQDLPDDVTLVDLDVGRVILAPTFAHNADIRKESTLTDDVTTARAIRSQVLYLAQSLGTVFGSCMDPVTWSCDRVSAPFLTDVNTDEQQQVGSLSAPFDRLKTVCHDFLQELLAGTTSCCYWVEEATSATSSTNTIEPTVLFDEDRFFRLKNQRFRQQQQQQEQQYGNHQLPPTSFRPLLRPPQDSTHLALSYDGWWLVLEILLRCQNMNDYISTRDTKEMMFSL